MEIYQIAAVGVISALIVVYLKTMNSELSMLAAVAAGIVLIVMSLSYVVEFVGFFSEFTQKTQLDPSIFKIVIKIIAISYFIEFSASLIEDFGLKNIADKVVFAGKMVILTLAAPIIKNLIEVVSGTL